MMYLSSLLFSTFTTVMLIPVFTRLSIRWKALDWPGERKVHSRAVPRCGGLAMVVGGVIPILFWVGSTSFTRAYLCGTFILVVFGAIDDFRGLGYRAKLIGQTAAALAFVLYGGGTIKSLGSLLPEGAVLAPWLATILTVVAIVGVTNALNLADGLDGLAGGISFLSLCCIGYLAYQGNSPVITLIAVAVCGSLFGFLRFNTHPASLFMGDTGSQLLGFSAITLSIVLTQGDTLLSPLLPLIILGFPVLDTLTVMTERMAEGRSPFAADRNHFHHRLMRFGFSHKEAVFLIYIIQVLLVVSAFFFRFHSDWVLLAGYGIFSAAVITGFHLADRKNWRFPRGHILDFPVKKQLNALAKKEVLIRVSFRALEWGLPALLLFAAFVPASIPLYVSLLSGAMAIYILTVKHSRSHWLKWVLPFSMYLLIPYLIYFGSTDQAHWVMGRLERVQNIPYLGLGFLIILVLRFTRRKAGFRATPLDFLVLFFFAFIAPRLQFENLEAHQLGIISAKVLTLFFAMEVVFGELRGKMDRFGLAIVLPLGVVTIRGLMPYFWG